MTEDEETMCCLLFCFFTENPCKYEIQVPLRYCILSCVVKCFVKGVVNNIYLFSMQKRLLKIFLYKSVYYFIVAIIDGSCVLHTWRN